MLSRKGPVRLPESDNREGIRLNSTYLGSALDIMGRDYVGSDQFPAAGWRAAGLP